MGITIWGGAIGRGHGRLMVNGGVCGEDSNSAWVNHKRDSVSMGEMGGMRGLVVS